MAQPEKVVPLADSVHPDTQPLAASHHTLSGHVLAPVDPAAGPRVGMMLGPYQLLEPLGQGGMGQVWRAQQTAPLKREVAVKLLSRSLDDRIAEAWFLVERQALAMLVHPYIAQIYDAGQLPGGLMFFAMELVEGQTLDRWVCDQLPDLPRLVALFERICQGIQHAHQRGLIHRDLKPANILVGEHQGEALPKIIDFGVAIGAGGGSQSTAGTRAYMAPEQARPDGRGIDARADVYGLGATLAALLCLRSGIRADGSTALSHLHAAAHASSLSRHGEHGGVVTAEQVQRLRRSVPRALRAILLKATAAEREQRYDSAAALAEDLRRWRSGHPVLAMGGGRAYAIGCFLRRNSWASAAAGVALLALLGGIAAALYGLTEARSAQALAEQRRVQAEGLVGAMLGDLADKLRPLGRLDLLETVGEEAMRYLTAAQASDSGGAVQRARALRTLGEVYVQRQKVDEARTAFEEAAQTLDAADPDSESLSELLFERGQVAFWQGNLYWMANDLTAARTHLQRYRDEAVALRDLDPSSVSGVREYAFALANLAAIDSQEGRLEKAAVGMTEFVETMERVYSTAPDPQTRLEIANAHSLLGTTLEKLGRPVDALARFEKQRQLLEQSVGIDAHARHQHAIALHLVARLESLLGHESASRHMDQAIESFEALVALEPENELWSTDLYAARVQLGEIQTILGRTDLAARTFKSILENASEERGAIKRARLKLALIDPGAAGSTTTGPSADEADDSESTIRDRALRFLLQCRMASCSNDGATNEASVIDRLTHSALERSQSATVLEARMAYYLSVGDTPALEVLLNEIRSLGYAEQTFLAMFGNT